MTYRHDVALNRAEEIIKDLSPGKDVPLKEYAALVKAYKILLDKFQTPDRAGHAPSPGKILEMSSNLLSGLSHEFRTPLTLIISLLDQMLPTSRDGEQERKLSLMHLNAQRILFLINQVLAMSEIDNRQLKLNAVPQELISFLKGINASFDLLARQNEVDLILEGEETGLTLYFDPEKMAETMSNLIMNALKYTPAGGRVTVSVSRPRPGTVEISVRDTGSGIPGDQLPLIFDRFYHLQKYFEHEKKGFGVGLYLIREYVKRHHGTIRVNSTDGEGTEFVIRLPEGNAHLEPDEIDELPASPLTAVGGKKISSHYAALLHMEREEARCGCTETPVIDTGGQDRDIVLMVEDDLHMRRLIVTLLKKHFTVVEAMDGAQGITLAKEIIPDIVISDILMPGVNGIKLCRDLKIDITTSHIPLILLSGKASEKDIIEGLEAGADDYVTKPFSGNALLARVKNLISLRRQLQQKIERQMMMQLDEFSLPHTENSFLEIVKELIEENLSDPDFFVDDLANALDMSRPTLYRKVSALTGQSPNKFIQSYRLKRSFDLLKSQYGNVTEVAYRVGFSSSAYFTKCFKEKFHQLPSDFTTV